MNHGLRWLCDHGWPMQSGRGACGMAYPSPTRVPRLFEKMKRSDQMPAGGIKMFSDEISQTGVAKYKP
jgi:hypothetical protein